MLERGAGVKLIGFCLIAAIAMVGAATAEPIITTTCTPSSVLVGGSVTITCTVTDDSGVKNVTVQIKDAKGSVTNFTMVAGASNTFSYEFTYTGKEGRYYIQSFWISNGSGFEENASTLNFSARDYYDIRPTPTPTPDVNATATPSPTPPLVWVRNPPRFPVTGREAVQIIGGVVGCVILVVLWRFLWRLNENIKKR